MILPVACIAVVTELVKEYTRDDIIEKTSMLCYNDVIAAQKFYEEHLEEIQENYKLRYGTTE